MSTQGGPPGTIDQDDGTARAISSQAHEVQRLMDQGYVELDRLGELAPTQAIRGYEGVLTTFKRVREMAQELGEEENEFRLAARRAIAEVFSQRGHQHRFLHNHAEALADLSQGLRLNPDRAEDYYYRGLSYLAKGDTTQARNDLTEYLRRGNLDFLRDRAKARIAALVPGKEDSKASLAHWRGEGMRLNSEASSLLNPRGEDVQPNWADGTRSYNRAIEAFNQALEANSNDGMTKIGLISALLEQAKAYRQIDEYDLALQNYERAQQVRPNVLHSFLRGETLLEAGHPALARAAFEEYLAKGDDQSLRAQAQKYLSAKNNQVTR